MTSAKSKPGLNKAYAASPDVVAREIEGELIVVPISALPGGTGDDLYTFNESGRAIWRRLDGRATLAGIAAALAEEYRTDREAVERDVLGLVSELLSRGIVIEKRSK